MQNNIIYLTTSNDLQVINFTDLVNFNVLDLIPIQLSNGLKIQGNTAYIAMQDGLQVINITDPSDAKTISLNLSPLVICYDGWLNNGQVAIEGNTAYLTTCHGLQIIYLHIKTIVICLFYKI